MADFAQEALDRVRRSIGQEFVQMEDDFDKTRDLRGEITDKLMSAVRGIQLTNDKGELSEDAEIHLKVINTGLKALSDAEKAKGAAISLKLKQNEQAIASAADAKERLAAVLAATAPGRIQETFDAGKLDQTLEEMFGSEIQAFETKSSNTDLSE